MASIKGDAVEKLTLPAYARYGAAVYGVIIAVMFNIIWFSALTPLLQTGDRIEYTFSVYIIDLVFIMPSFVIAAYLALRRKYVGVVGLPALFILGIGIISPLALAEIIKPGRYGMAANSGDCWY